VPWRMAMCDFITISFGMTISGPNLTTDHLSRLPAIT
jgi:hypothetical protein